MMLLVAVLLLIAIFLEGAYPWGILLTVSSLYFEKGRIPGGCYKWVFYCQFSIFPEGTYP